MTASDVAAPGMVALLLVSACGSATHDTAPMSKEEIASNLLEAAPQQLDTRMSKGFTSPKGEKLTYLGNTVEVSTPVRPGEEIVVHHYWRIDNDISDRWSIFSHVDGERRQDRMTAPPTDLQRSLPVGRWPVGKIVRDEQRFELRHDWTSKTADIYVGLRRGLSLGDRMAVIGQAGSQTAAAKNRILAARIAVASIKKSGPYIIRKTPTPLVIDGRAHEPAWKKAGKSPLFVAAEGGPALKGSATARLLWDDDYLYVLVQMRDRSVSSQYKAHDDPLWKEDVVEVFIDADRNRRGYIELQVNPNNAQFDAWFATRRGGKTDFAWTAKMTSQVMVYGTVNKNDDRDRGWDAEFAIPHIAVKGGSKTMRVDTPPKVGQRWNLNIVWIDQDKTVKRTASWNRISYSDFHGLDRMLTPIFGDENGATTPKPTALRSAQAGKNAQRPEAPSVIRGKPSTTRPGSIRKTGQNPRAQGTSPASRVRPSKTTPPKPRGVPQSSGPRSSPAPR